MTIETYKIVRTDTGWSVNHDGRIEGDYVNKEAAFEAAVAAASNAIKDGVGVSLSVAERSAGETNLGE